MANTCIPCTADGNDVTFESAADYYAHMETVHDHPHVETGDVPQVEKKKRGPRRSKIPTTTPRTNTRTSPRKPRKKK